MSVLNNSSVLLLADTAAPTGYNIERSLRFNSSDSAYLSRTPASAGNRKTWTWAGWVKRSKSDSFNAEVFGAGSNNLSLSFIGDSVNIYEYNGSILWQRTSTAVYRDFSAWYHVTIAYDTTQSTAANRVKIYVNGIEITAFSTNTDPSLNYDGYVNSAIAHYICRQTANNRYFNGYLADIHFIDGQALTPSSFGEFDTNGVWQPKAYAGSYGTNGFRLDFSDNSAATATTLGKDRAGSNNWTPNNFSVTAGAGNDSLVDSPTNYGTDTGAGGEVRGNYCTLNPLSLRPNITLANGNLDYTLTSVASPPYAALSTIAPSSGKWYTEITLTSSASAGGYTYWAGGGLYSSSYSNFTGASVNTNPGYGGFWSAGVRVTSYFTWATNDIIGFAWDLNAATLSVYKNG